MVKLKIVDEHELQDFGGSFTSSTSSNVDVPSPAIKDDIKHMHLTKDDQDLEDPKQQHQAGTGKGSKLEDIGASYLNPWQQLQAWAANPTWSRCLSVALGAAMGTLLVLVVVLVVVSRAKASSDSGDWLDAPTALVSNLTVASPSRVLTNDDCASAWQVLGMRMARSQPSSVLVSWECTIPTGAALPSKLVLALSFISSGSESDACAQAIHDRVVGSLSSVALSSALVALNVGCKAELLYQDSFNSTLLVVSEQRGQAILLPGQQAHLTIKTCTPATPSGSSSPATSNGTTATKPPVPSGPATCVAKITLRNSNNKPIPYHSPRDNCLRMVYAALPYFTAASIRVTPWCTQYGNTTGTVEFYQPLLTPAQYEALASQVQTSKSTAAAILSALKITSTCKASLSISALNCLASSSSFSLTSQTARDVFGCSPGSE